MEISSTNLYFRPTSIRESPSIIMPPPAGAEGLLGRVDEPHILIPHVPQLLGEGLHVPYMWGFISSLRANTPPFFSTRRVSRNRARLSAPVMLW